MCVRRSWHSGRLRELRGSHSRVRRSSQQSSASVVIPTTDSSMTLALVEDLGVAAATLSSLVKARATPKARRSVANVAGRNPSSTRIATRVMTILTLLAKPLFPLHLLPPLHTLPRRARQCARSVDTPGSRQPLRDSIPHSTRHATLCATLVWSVPLTPSRLSRSTSLHLSLKTLMTISAFTSAAGLLWSPQKLRKLETITPVAHPLLTHNASPLRIVSVLAMMTGTWTPWSAMLLAWTNSGQSP